MATRVALGAARGRLVQSGAHRESRARRARRACSGRRSRTAERACWSRWRRRAFLDSPTSGPTCACSRVALAAAILTGLLFGLAPALELSRSGPALLLRSGLGQSSRGRGRLQRGFVAVQLALSVVLLVGAGLLLAQLRAPHRGGSRVPDRSPAGRALRDAAAHGGEQRRPHRDISTARSSESRRCPALSRRRRDRTFRSPGSNSSTSVEIDGLATTPDATAHARCSSAWSCRTTSRR